MALFLLTAYFALLDGCVDRYVIARVILYMLPQRPSPLLSACSRKQWRKAGKSRDGGLRDGQLSKR